MTPVGTRMRGATRIPRARPARSPSSPWLDRRGPMPRSETSRAASDRLLAELASSHYSPAGWVRFLGHSFQRSREQVAVHRRAALEVTAASTVLAAGGHRVAASLTWCLAMTHLGLLGEGDLPLGWPNRLTLLRANLPAVAARNPALGALAALGTDFLDGRLARRGNRSTGFGAFADGLADSIFWSWFLMRFEPSAAFRALGLALWAGPPAAIIAAYLKEGRTVDFPRPQAFRVLSVGCQLLIGSRAIRHRLTRFRDPQPPLAGGNGEGLP